MTVKQSEDLLLWSARRRGHRRCRAANVPRRVENLLLLKKWFRWLSRLWSTAASQGSVALLLPVGGAVAAEISIIKIGLVYVIMIVIAAVVMAGATQHSHTR